MAKKTVSPCMAGSVTGTVNGVCLLIPARPKVLPEVGRLAANRAPCRMVSMNLPMKCPSACVRAGLPELTEWNLSHEKQ